MTKRQKWEQIKANYPDIAKFMQDGIKAGLTWGEPRIYQNVRVVE